MTRWISHLAIALYLGILVHGIFCHALQYRVASHPLMYFTVWDMFCGWSGWSDRIHIVAEGESGAFYELTPAPWGEYHAFADLGREHYDPFGNHACRIGLNCLRQTDHEPIARLHVIEETWSKKFNVPDSLWSRLHEEPKQPAHYFHRLATYRADGSLVERRQSFQDAHRASWLAASLRGQIAPQRHTPLLVDRSGTGSGMNHARLE